METAKSDEVFAAYQKLLAARGFVVNAARLFVLGEIHQGELGALLMAEEKAHAEWILSTRGEE